MKTKTPRANLEPQAHYLVAVHSHVERLLSQIAPFQHRFTRPDWLGDQEGLAKGSAFAVELQMALGYLAGDLTVPAVEVPDLLLAVHLVVDGVVGCELLAQAILEEHQDLASRPLVD